MRYRVRRDVLICLKLTAVSHSMQITCTDLSLRAVCLLPSLSRFAVRDSR